MIMKSSVAYILLLMIMGIKHPQAKQLEFDFTKHPISERCNDHTSMPMLSIVNRDSLLISCDGYHYFAQYNESGMNITNNVESISDMVGDILGSKISFTDLLSCVFTHDMISNQIFVENGRPFSYYAKGFRYLYNICYQSNENQDIVKHENLLNFTFDSAGRSLFLNMDGYVFVDNNKIGFVSANLIEKTQILYDVNGVPYFGYLVSKYVEENDDSKENLIFKTGEIRQDGLKPLCEKSGLSNYITDVKYDNGTLVFLRCEIEQADWFHPDYCDTFEFIFLDASNCASVTASIPRNIRILDYDYKDGMIAILAVEGIYVMTYQ